MGQDRKGLYRSAFMKKLNTEVNEFQRIPNSPQIAFSSPNTDYWCDKVWEIRMYMLLEIRY